MTDHQVIKLWPFVPPGSESWTHEEIEFSMPFMEDPSKEWRGIRNVVTPILTVYKPAPGKATGAGMIVSPGGGFRLLAYDYEGTDVAEWLAARGITAFLLKYRVEPTPPDHAQFIKESMELVAKAFGDLDHWVGQLDTLRLMAVDDGLHALKLIRERAAEFGVAPNKIGMIGFSAGAGLTLGAALSDPAIRPDFAASIYGMDRGDQVMDANGPPLFMVVSENDPFRLAAQNIRLYQRWIVNGAAADLHIFSEGGHGYGLRKLGLTTDAWPILFEGWLKKVGALGKGV